MKKVIAVIMTVVLGIGAWMLWENRVRGEKK